jgi:glycosyltransferase involved in cell wall biosynthesis
MSESTCPECAKRRGISPTLWLAAIAAYFGGTMVEFFTPGDASELAQCILRLDGDRKRLADLARNSARFNERYNWLRIGAEYVALVERLGAQPARRRFKKQKGFEG